MIKTTRREFLKEAGVCAAGVTLLGEKVLGKQAVRSGKHPNLVIVFPDQMRAHAQGFVGEDPVRTPVLDRFARQGVVFSQAVSNYPVCSPFRGMLMTGKYPHANGVLANCNTSGKEHGYELRTDERCWSDILSERGYNMGYIGKWHLDSPSRPHVNCSNNSPDFAWNEWCPPSRRHGFDDWYAYGTYDQHMRPLYWDKKAGRDEFRYIDQWGPEHEADRAISFINENGRQYKRTGKPFALVVSMNPPHMPYDKLPKRYSDLNSRRKVEEFCNRTNIPPAGTRWGDYYRKHIRNYLAMVTGVDEQFGRILEALREQGIEKDTIVLFTSDHGNCLGIHDEISKNNHYEESMRIPFIIRWPGKIAPRTDDLLLSVPDIYPTLLELMGFAADIPGDVEGVSRADFLLDGTGKRPSSQLYLWMPYGGAEWGRRGVRTHSHTMVLSRMPEEPDSLVLHDNTADPFQLQNIAGE
ncbi:MAG: sulfatase, partial [Candidatus Aminicenantes bacterium]|nr:sulfatase [Candidatus Aminicenantes bacterium]